MNDISKYFTKPNYAAQFVAQQILKHEGTPKAIQVFAEHEHKLDDYSYWFLLSTCWVSYTGWSELDLWKTLFSSNRSKRKHCVMKPSEVKAFDYLPNIVSIYRAHRPNETDWIAYTLDTEIAYRFARERGVNTIKEYKVDKRHILALFLRRGEKEVIILDKEKIRFIKEINVPAVEILCSN